MFQALVERRNVLIEVLSEQAGKEPGEDRFKVGYITAVNDILNVGVDDVVS